MSAILVSQRVVMFLARTNVEDVTYREELDEPGFAREFVMEACDHEDFGYPEFITLTIEPGDLLNQPVRNAGSAGVYV